MHCRSLFYALRLRLRVCDCSRSANVFARAHTLPTCPESRLPHAKRACTFCQQLQQRFPPRTDRNVAVAYAFQCGTRIRVPGRISLILHRFGGARARPLRNANIVSSGSKTSSKFYQNHVCMEKGAWRRCALSMESTCDVCECVCVRVVVLHRIIAHLAFAVLHTYSTYTIHTVLAFESTRSSTNAKLH